MDIGNLFDIFSEEMIRFKVNFFFFYIYTQLKNFKYLKENIMENKSLIHVDFSKNYECKLASQI